MCQSEISIFEEKFKMQNLEFEMQFFIFNCLKNEGVNNTMKVKI